MLKILSGKRPLRRALLVGLVLMGLLAAVGASPGLTHSPGKLRAGFGTPTIDGVRGAGEWAGAAEAPIFTTVLPGSALLIMNDAENLYIAAAVTDSTLTDTDSLEIRFDNDHNGVTDEGDDRVGLAGNLVFHDRHHEAAAAGWSTLDAVYNGTGSVGAAGGVSFFEISHPLSSGDAHDIAVAPGATLGVCVRYFEDGASGGGRTFPPSCQLASNAQSLYADVELAFMIGDVDCDDVVDAVDAALILQYVAGLTPGLPLCGTPDANEDGFATAVDAALILQYAAGLIPSLPA